ncbi:claspin-like [Colletes gigas]|uniref:claspin-like n=1 Tax=Colletes gigas TaxID=935657 RepID=UPI001C9B9AF1|nr:claspin-like [Colletes gigas]
MKMSESCDVNYTNGENMSNKGDESSEIELNKETIDCIEKVQNVFTEASESKENIDTDIPNETIKEIDKDLVQDEPDSSNAHKKFSEIIDSDLDDEDLFPSKTKRKKPVYDSSENETSDSKESIKSKAPLNKKKTKMFLDSDSDETCDITFNNDNVEISNEEKATNDMQNRLKAIIDSDSESEAEDEKQVHLIKSGAHKKQKEHSEPKRKVSVRASKEEAMKQIHSETQRLIREREVSLPYHIPKQRTLQEFLSRKKVLSALPKASTMATKLKISSTIIDEALKEKEKEAEIFYKSSDSEEEEVESHSPAEKENANIENAQDLKKENISRKLFVDDDLCIDNNKENNSNVTQEVHETLTEIKDTESNKPSTDNITENNTSDSAILEIHGEINENENLKLGTTELVEVTENKVDDLLEKKNVEEENAKENATNSIDESNNESLNTSTSIVSNDYAKIVQQSLGIAAGESDEYNEYGLPPPKFDDSPNINEQKMLLSRQREKPKLKGTPGLIIDLSDDIKPNKSGINALIDRFVFKHSTSNKPNKNARDVTVTQVKESPNELVVIKETLPYKPANIENEDPMLSKPGAKLMRLKEELKHKMALKRNEEWKQKEQDMKEQEIEWNESTNEEDNLSEPCSPSIESYKKEEEEDEDDDIYAKKENKKSKCDFIDSEAEVSDDEMNDSDEIIDEDEDETLKEEKDCEKLILEDDDGSSTCDSSNISLKPKIFKRIVETLDDDSRSCDAGTSEVKKTFDAVGNEDFSGNESDIPLSQQHVEINLNDQTPQRKTNTFNFVSPLTQLTVLNTDSMSEKESTKEEQSHANETETILLENSQIDELFQPTQNSGKQASQKKLFVDQTNLLDEELMDLCSGKFTQDKNSLNLSKEPNMTESQLLELCSGTFSTQANNATNARNQLSTEMSQDKSVLLDEDSLSIEKDTRNKEQPSKEDEMPWNRLSIVSSDEEDQIETEIKRSKKKAKRLDMSDDEDENASASGDEQTEDEDKYIDYDSEENEVVVSKKNIKQYAANFLEKEAELSESDCDVSADEDEEDLDKLELEEVDDEDIDETEVKRQLGKFHMRQVLDEDQKEVNMLKELLFEDGDLFSESKRERKLRWKNIDKQFGNDTFGPSEDKDGWVDFSDEEDEAKWRKLRHEREKFLAEKMANVNTAIEDDLNSSEVFKLGLKILKKKRLNETESQDTLLEMSDSKRESRIPHTIADMLNNSQVEGNSRTIHSVMKKRSFLARGEKSLKRLAVLAKQKDAPKLSRNGKNFVFTYIEPSMENKDIPIAEKEPQQNTVKRRR